MRKRDQDTPSVKTAHEISASKQSKSEMKDGKEPHKHK